MPGKRHMQPAFLYDLVNSDGVKKVTLERTKSRVAPLKTLSIPRLELMACCIGARLANSVRNALDLPDMKITFWTDSSGTLWWIREHGDWSVFVTNRVKEIKQLTRPQLWHHVPVNINPADLLSRGCSIKHMLKSKLWHGPNWLLMPSECWPLDNVCFDINEIEAERRKTKLSSVNLSEDTAPFENVNVLIHLIQNQYFADKNSVSIDIFRDDVGILRVKTRITERKEVPDFLSPILLPSDCILTKCLIESVHRKNYHAGTQIMLSILREKFWIVKSRKTVRNVLNCCLRCKRYKAKPLTTESCPLPEDRVSDTVAFEVTEVDIVEPIFLRGISKVWILFFTYAVYQDVHLELVVSLSTDSFLMAFRRFMSRRGRPRTVYSDNGTNFRGANNELSELCVCVDWEKITGRQTFVEFCENLILPQLPGGEAFGNSCFEFSKNC
ncbi:putative RNA-directed DNA polymerase from transposon X-element [Trichonephila clavipes]|nr:putative RNA-directed DNA polymerase from transposon X-element [Trichonephila clavipes]